MLLRRSHDCGNGTYHDCGLINVNFVAGARNHYLPAVGRQLREIALQSHDYSQIRVPVLAFVGYPPLPEDQILANHITDPAERTIVYAVFEQQRRDDSETDQENRGRRTRRSGRGFVGRESLRLSLE
jgi:hypothetical protein